MTERRLPVAGVSTAVLEGGHGPPVVFLQAEFAAVRMRVIPELVETLRVIAPDLPRLGASQMSNGPPDVDTVPTWVGELIDQTCPTPPCSSARGRRRHRRAVRDRPRRSAAGMGLVDTHGLAPYRPAPGLALPFAGVRLRPTERGLERGFRNYCFPGLDRLRGELWGRHHRGVRLDVARLAGDRYDWGLHVIEDARDDPAIEQPQAFLEALRTALGGG